MQEYLTNSEVIDWMNPDILVKARLVTPREKPVWIELFTLLSFL
jgi:hypothetical protein